MEKVFANIFGLVLVFACGWAASFLNARVLQDLWRWFIAGPLHLPLISFWEAMGLILTIGFFLSHIAKEEPKWDEDTHWATKAFTKILTAVVVALIFWGLGAIYAGFL